MKTDGEIKDDVYKFIKPSILMKSVSGVLSKTKRPKDSDKEDVVISVLANEAGQRQEATVNVNVYIKSLLKKGQLEEDTLRTKEIGKICSDLFESFRGDAFWCKLVSQRVYEVEAVECYVINNKLSYSQINL